MTTSSLLSRLLAYRPRDGVSPRENFLTEAIAHALDVAPTLALAIVERVTGSSFDPASSVTVETQRRYSHPLESRVVQPDMVVHVGGDTPVTVLFEHKWDSVASTQQLQDYAAVAKKIGAVVAFVGARVSDRLVARDVVGSQASFLWEELFVEFERASSEEPAVIELLSFLREQGLAPQVPLSTAELEAYAHGIDVPTKCGRIARLLAGAEWRGAPPSSEPLYFEDPPKRKRMGVKFRLLPPWDIPFVFVGILLDASYFGVTPAGGGSGPDVTLMLDAHDRDLELDRWAPLLSIAASIGQQEGVDVRTAAEIKRPFGAMVVQIPLIDVIRGRATESEQVEVVQRTLESWLLALEESELVGALRSRYEPVWRPEHRQDL